MSIRIPEDLTLRPPEAPPTQYLATILEKPVYWDDRDGCPVWPEDEPMAYTFEPGGGITVAPICDIGRLPGYVRVPKALDCGHHIRGGAFYVVLTAGERRLCLDCASRLSEE